MNETIKKKIIHYSGVVLVFATLFSTGYAIGRNRRLAAVQQSGNGALESATELKDRNAALESELEQRVRDFELIQQQQQSIITGIDGCIDSVGRIREQCDISSITARDTLTLIKELRRRFEESEERSRGLEEELRDIRQSLEK